jgi:hypothetical protein
VKYVILVSLLFLGCNESKEYKQFVKKYHNNYRYYCKDGFLMKETFQSPKAKEPLVSLINSQKCYKN